MPYLKLLFSCLNILSSSLLSSSLPYPPCLNDSVSFPYLKLLYPFLTLMSLPQSGFSLPSFVCLYTCLFTCLSTYYLHCFLLPDSLTSLPPPLPTASISAFCHLLFSLTLLLMSCLNPSKLLFHPLASLPPCLSSCFSAPLSPPLLPCLLASLPASCYLLSSPTLP